MSTRFCEKSYDHGGIGAAAQGPPSRLLVTLDTQTTRIASRWPTGITRWLGLGHGATRRRRGNTRGLPTLPLAVRPGRLLSTNPGRSLPAVARFGRPVPAPRRRRDRKSTRLNSSHLGISYA